MRACHVHTTAVSDAARFDVYAHPDPVVRKSTPFLLDVQNTHIGRIATRVEIPMRLAADFALRMHDLNPGFEVGGKAVVLDTLALAAIPMADVKKPILHLGAGHVVRSLLTGGTGVRQRWVFAGTAFSQQDATPPVRRPG